jgi:hypothetical protein
MAPKLNHRRAVFVLSKIDEILAWEKAAEQERDTRFVDLGRYLCEVRAGQYWRVDNLKSFDEFLDHFSQFPNKGRRRHCRGGVSGFHPTQGGVASMPAENMFIVSLLELSEVTGLERDFNGLTHPFRPEYSLHLILSDDIEDL